MKLIANPLIKDLCNSGGQCYVVGEAIRNEILGLYVTKVEVLVNNIKITKLATIISKYSSLDKTELSKNILKTIYNGLEYIFILRAVKEKDMENEVIKFLKNKYFTINGIGYDINNVQWLNPFDGIRDMKIGVIKLIEPKAFIQNPEIMLMATRLASQLNYAIPLETWFSIYENAKLIKSIHPDTIKKELSALLLTDKPSIGFKYMQETGLLSHIFPELAISESVIQTRRSTATNVFSHTMYALDASEKDLIIRLSVLLHDVGKHQTMTCDTSGNIHFFGHEKVGSDIAKKRLTELNFPSKIVEAVSHLILHHMFDASPQLKPIAVRRLIKKVGKEHIDNLIKLREADRKGSPEKISMRKIELLKKKIQRELKHG